MRTCVLRCAFSLPLEQGKLNTGFSDYLIPEDMETLKLEIRERAELHNALNTITVLEEAQNLKIHRNNFAISFLQLMRSDGLAETRKEKTINKPKRSWINKVLEYLDAKLAVTRFIDGKRFLAVSYDATRDYFNTFSTFIRSF